MSVRDSLDYSFVYKVISVGNKNVGKTSLLSRFVTQQFDEHIRATIGVDHFSTIVRVGPDKVKVQLWDTSGNDRFKTMTRVYYRAAPAAIAVYDITDAGSFENLSMWISEVREHADPNVIILVIGNKTDLDAHRAVSTEQGADFARANHVMFTETSALSDSNVTDAFRSLIEKIHNGRPRLARDDSTQLSALSHTVLPDQPPVDLTAPRRPPLHGRVRQACCS